MKKNSKNPKYRYTNIGLIEYVSINEHLYYKNKEVPSIEAYNTPEEAKLKYYLEKKTELLQERNTLQDKLNKINTKVSEIDKEFEVLLQKHPEYII